MNQHHQTNPCDTASLPAVSALSTALLEGWRRKFVNRSQPYAVQ